MEACQSPPAVRNGQGAVHVDDEVDRSGDHTQDFKSDIPKSFIGTALKKRTLQNSPLGGRNVSQYFRSGGFKMCLNVSDLKCVSI